MLRVKTTTSLMTVAQPANRRGHSWGPRQAPTEMTS